MEEAMKEAPTAAEVLEEFQHTASFRAVWVVDESQRPERVLASRRYATVERRWRQSCARAGKAAPEPLPTDEAVLEAWRRHVHGRSTTATMTTSAGDAVTLAREDTLGFDPFARSLCALGVEERASPLWPIVTGSRGRVRVLVLALVPARSAMAATAAGARGTAAMSIRARGALLAPLPVLSAAADLAETLAGVASGRPAQGMDVKDVVHSFLSTACPYGSPLETDPAWVGPLALRDFAKERDSNPPSSDAEPFPFWKPFMHRGRPRLVFEVTEQVSASMHGSERGAVVEVHGRVQCRAEIEGLPEIVVPLIVPPKALLSLTVHPCAEASASTGGALCFSPPLGLFTLARYRAGPQRPHPPITGEYTFRDEGPNARRIELALRLEEDAAAPGTSVEACEVTFPFHGRAPAASVHVLKASAGQLTVAGGTPVWKLGPRFGAKGAREATLAAVVTFAAHGAPLEPDDPLCRGLTGFARVSFKLAGASETGVGIEPREIVAWSAGVGALHAPVELTTSVVSAPDAYLLWNTLGESRESL
mmetsp:Transcript_7472/g.24810  ORF Transcript_7472/g.24810 Transcript_7472/m.24810 type:complete len:536 (-) Transcript_7472:3346-4953(-)